MLMYTRTYLILLKCLFWWTIIIYAAPKINKISINSKSWPPMKTYDIWGSLSEEDRTSSNSKINQRNHDNNNLVGNNNVAYAYTNDAVKNTTNEANNKHRFSKVLNFFPVPMNEECLSNDGRRTGICFNVYECRQKGGNSKGECAMGFGVCCVFIASCNQDITMNSTYIVSPNFPSAMTTNLTSCKMKIKMMSPDISQLRFDFYHFSLGQPNRKTGVCDGDIFQMTGGLGGSFTLCGQNSGQHVYYDVGGRVTARQSMNMNSIVSNSVSNDNNLSEVNSSNNMTSSESGTTNTMTGNNDSLLQMSDIEILMNFTNRILPTRIWEIRVLQISFSQRAPAGCLQYFTGPEGIIQTFNFADNGRHLANQNYKSCIRQEKDMCSIIYQPCDEESFKIGPNNLANDEMMTVSSDTSQLSNVENVTSMTNLDSMQIGAGNVSADMPLVAQTLASDMNSSSTQPATTTTTTESVEAVQTSPSTVEADEPLEEDEEIEGSGDAVNDLPVVVSTTRSPVGGGLDVFSFLSNVFDFRRRRSSRHFFPACTDRITMPCIVEDFIGAGMGTIPGCEPVHCGDNFCSHGTNLNCKIESTVTPFYLGVHFGEGLGKGSPEENIGACLKYSQMPCL